MKLHDLVALAVDGVISPEDAAELNRDLASKTLSDIAPEERQNVLDYLLSAMRHDSVDHDLRGKIDALIIELQGR
ncbi:hypothetical protein DSM25558_4369 [Agrobacterium sp. DSM 25558]|uniref:hypothetical protein n=1 Tax=Agrobacterium sp. DSM 25558 TaxID=1907665 RepID=UPI0009724442|nr:hypothetical protein [Agrobacterium sp. DSM 25558]SCX28089.1 hypothetical protein DSM25558_4369 [Agrobacterium sp. DSM 25558]